MIVIFRHCSLLIGTVGFRLLLSYGGRWRSNFKKLLADTSRSSFNDRVKSFESPTNIKILTMNSPAFPSAYVGVGHSKNSLLRIKTTEDALESWLWTHGHEIVSAHIFSSYCSFIISPLASKLPLCHGFYAIWFNRLS